MQRPPVYAIVLAAGSSRRFGSTKQLADYRGDTLVARACRIAESILDGRTVLVGGADFQAVAESAGLTSGFFVYNERYAEGMATSIAAGVRAVADVAAGVMVLLADQPLVTAGHLESLLRRFEAAPDNIIATGFSGTEGPPVIFPSVLLAELAGLEGDQGARPVLEKHAERLETVVFDQAAADVDRPADLAKLP